MNKLSKTFGTMMQKMLDLVMGSGLSQDETVPEGQRYITPGIPELIRLAGAEGCVLLRNDGALPLDTDDEIAVFGRCQLDWFFVGYGSGGDVHSPYTVNLMEGLKNAGVKVNKEVADRYLSWTQSPDNKAYHGWWGHWPYSHPEMPIEKELVLNAAKSAKTALVVIGRAAGEDRENTLTKGSYYLTNEERAMLDTVTSSFEKTVVIMNIGNIIDMSWTEEYKDKISAILIGWLGGMESGNAVADVLTGKVSPCGKLADTIARRYEDYPSSENFGGLEYNEYKEGVFIGYRYFDMHPDKVLWKFGHGLGYTTFEVEAVDCKLGKADVKVTNTGARAGKEVVQLYCKAPKGSIEKPERVLIAFAKTKELAPGESEILSLEYDTKYISSYDEKIHAFVLEKGEYSFIVNGKSAGSVLVDEDTLVEQCEDICIPSSALRSRILDRLPEKIAFEGNKEYKFSDVMEGKISLDDFIATLSDEELEALTRGHGMMGSPLGVPGNAGVLGGVIPSLQEKGVRPVSCCDGPAGLRMKRYCALQPCGTALACTWNTELIEALSRKIGEEMNHYGVDVVLAPGMNIHRNPLCGRNFEYFSEDPVLSGKMAAATVRGVQSTGRASCPKHFACNNQEVRRNTNDSRVSERALREIYLRNFEICVKEANPKTIMTSYNKINGVWSHYNYDLATTVLRKEWGFDGMVMTDWWMRKSKSPEFPEIKNNAYRVRAGVDVFMPGDMGHTARGYKSDGSLKGITRAEMQRSAKTVLELIMKLKDCEDLK